MAFSHTICLAGGHVLLASIEMDQKNKIESLIKRNRINSYLVICAAIFKFIILSYFIISVMIFTTISINLHIEMRTFCYGIKKGELIDGVKKRSIKKGFNYSTFNGQHLFIDDFFIFQQYRCNISYKDNIVVNKAYQMGLYWM